jgi:threonine/homoserine/homoserine lactone efflux protein
MSWQEFTALFVFCTAMSFSPGPNTTLATALAANHGLRRALPFCLAVPAGWTLLMLACGLGLGALITGVPALRWSVKLAGIAYMLWLAAKLMGVRFQLISNAKSVRAEPAQASTTQPLSVSFPQGVLLQFVNIKAWLLALTLAAGWVAVGSNQTERLAIVSLTMVFFAFSSNFCYALIGSALREWLAVGARLAWFNRAMACVLLATAAWMVTV